jgi:ATP-dependent Clp protease adapter protein ClpS
MRRRGFAGRGACASSGQEFAVPSRTQTQERDAVQTQPMPLYHTIVHNCECHTFEDVIFGLMRIVGTGLRDAERKAREIDFFGRGIVATTTLEVAELYAQRLHNEVVSASGTLLGTSIEPAT